MFADQMRAGLLAVWLIISSVILPVLVAPFVLPPRTVFSLAPQCEWRAKHGRECVLCGMTTSFVLISEGRLDAALHKNRGSVPLFAAMVLNDCVAILYVLGRIRRAWGRGRRPELPFRSEELPCRL
jgi:hypothetical protein